MKVRYSENVKKTINSYRKSLNRYSLSKERKAQKIRLLRKYLKSTIKNICKTIGSESFPICNSKKLGQIFTPENEPCNKYLHQTTFADESETQWSISFMLVENNKTLLICSLMQSQLVSENVSNKVDSLLNKCFNKTPMNTNKCRLIRMNESEFENMVRNITRQVILESQEYACYKPVGLERFGFCDVMWSKNGVYLFRRRDDGEFLFGREREHGGYDLMETLPSWIGNEIKDLFPNEFVGVSFC